MKNNSQQSLRISPIDHAILALRESIKLQRQHLKHLEAIAAKYSPPKRQRAIIDPRTKKPFNGRRSS